MKFSVFNRRRATLVSASFSFSLFFSLCGGALTERTVFEEPLLIFGSRASRYVSRRVLKRAIGLAQTPKGQNTLAHLPARNPSSASMIKRSPHLSFPFSHPPLPTAAAPLSSFPDPRRMEGLEVASMCHGIGRGTFLLLVRKAVPSREASGRRVGSGARVCMRGCTSAEIFLKERRLTGTRSGRSLEGVHLRRGAEKKRERETRTGKERYREEGEDKEGERKRERESIEEEVRG